MSRKTETADFRGYSMKKVKEFTAFANLTDRLLSVSHNEVKEKMEAEKKAKKRKKSKTSSASREVGGSG